jgi:hypothetical protein
MAKDSMMPTSRASLCALGEYLRDCSKATGFIQPVHDEGR